ncbi:MAG TPA: hypothetical protein PKZ84_04435 [Anaerolineae bacterium]|nr:hypothetical protein [Anaerolineae bacterium]HQI83815.1 hypothetical protein [Anaerolineae bacterium]
MMKTRQILRAMTLLSVALALAAGLWGVVPTPVARAATCTSASAGNWSTISWSGCTPGSGDDVVIAHDVTLDIDVTVSGITINSGVTFNGGSKTLTLGGNYFTNKGTFIAGTGTVKITGANFRLWDNPTTFNNVTLTGSNADFATVAATINGTFTIESGYVAAGKAPVYADGSTLRYATGGSYTAYEEWYPNTTSGAGVPYHVVVASGTTLTFGSNTSARTMRGDLTIDGAFTLSSGLGGDLNIAGNWVNNGTFTANNRRVTFNGNGNRTISGSSSTSFAFLTVNLGTSAANVLEAQSIISVNTGELTVDNGTFRLSSASTITPFSGSEAIGATAGFYLNHSGAVSNWGNSGPLTLNGLLTVAAGTMNVGSASGNELAVTGSAANLTVSGGTLNVTGRIRSTGQVNISGGQIVVPTVGQGSGTYASFYMQATGRLSMSGGTVILVRANGNSAGGDLRIESGTGSKTITGGTFQIGNASTPANQTIQVSSEIPVWNLTTAGVNSPTARVVTALILNNAVTIGSGTTLDANSLSIQIRGDWTNSGTFTPGTGTVMFDGSSLQSINGTTGFYNMALNNAAGASLGQAQIVANQLTLASGRLMLGDYNLTLGAAASIGGSPGDSAMVVTNGSGALRKQFSDTGSFTFPVGDNTGTANYSPATLNFTSGSFSDAYAAVRVTDAKHPANNATDHLSRYWTVSSSGITNFSCDVTFDYIVGSEDVVGTESTLKALKYDSGSGWTIGNAVDAGNHRFSMSVSSFSDFTGGDNPTAVTLARFEATPQGNAILLTWETAAELDNVGFNLYRSAKADGPYTQLNATLIPPQNPGSVLGGVYEWPDTDVQPGATYFYKLEDIDVKGVSTFHGPISTAVIAAPAAVGLRSLSARGLLLPLALGWVVTLGVAVARRRKRNN